MLKALTRARQRRPDCTHRNAQDLRYLLVRETFQLPEPQYVLKTLGETADSLLEELCVRVFEQEGFRIDGSTSFAMYFLVELGRERLRAVVLEPPERRCAYDAEQPCTRI